MSLIEDLKQPEALRASGSLTEDEYAAAKATICCAGIFYPAA